ncbi:hypothetical protein HDU99_001591, partial [Rhizoclosmatium hyalinum]
MFIETTNSKGRCLVATTYIARGSVVATEVPVAASPSPGHCSFCYGSNASKVCTGCRLASFCSVACQRSNWPSHKGLCRQLKAGASIPRSPQPLFALFVAVVDHSSIAVTVDALAADRSRFDSTTIEAFGRMVVARQAALASNAPHPVDSSSTTNPGDAARQINLLCKISCNAVGISHPSTFEDCGVALFPETIAKANHSCVPNCTLLFDLPSASARLIALQDITPDTELTISYIDAADPFPIRQKDLQSRYHFTCTCPLCILQLPQEHTYACQSSPTCKGFFQYNPPTIPAPTPCTCCKSTTNPIQPIQTLTSLSKQCTPKDTDPSNLSHLLTLQTRLLSPNSPLTLQTRQRLYSIHLSSANWQSALLLCNEIACTLESIYPPLSPSLGLQYLSLCRLALLVAQDSHPSMYPAILKDANTLMGVAEKAHVVFSTVLGDSHLLTLEAKEKRHELGAFYAAFG